MRVHIEFFVFVPFMTVVLLFAAYAAYDLGADILAGSCVILAALFFFGGLREATLLAALELCYRGYISHQAHDLVRRWLWRD